TESSKTCPERCYDIFERQEVGHPAGLVEVQKTAISCPSLMVARPKWQQLRRSEQLRPRPQMHPPQFPAPPSDDAISPRLNALASGAEIANRFKQRAHRI